MEIDTGPGATGCPVGSRSSPGHRPLYPVGSNPATPGGPGRSSTGCDRALGPISTGLSLPTRSRLGPCSLPTRSLSISLVGSTRYPREGTPPRRPGGPGDDQARIWTRPGRDLEATRWRPGSDQARTRCLVGPWFADLALERHRSADPRPDAPPALDRPTTVSGTASPPTRRRPRFDRSPTVPGRSHR